MVIYLYHIYSIPRSQAIVLPGSWRVFVTGLHCMSEISIYSTPGKDKPEGPSFSIILTQFWCKKLDMLLLTKNGLKAVTRAYLHPTLIDCKLLLQSDGRTRSHHTLSLLPSRSVLLYRVICYLLYWIYRQYLSGLLRLRFKDIGSHSFKSFFRHPSELAAVVVARHIEVYFIFKKFWLLKRN